ncbi:DUF3141 domain-containing protein [Marinivivus vitaminiproducens]|uniref:DUF3141 domain-containing protein n=1 Tax=Marinivivus vitaminiproducens TaxID=3035935 RepID=UPI002798DB9D|nr:DUF3141 domain-containing protein [Geminicoccaceae bacterium SCSIO 64248]
MSSLPATAKTTVGQAWAYWLDGFERSILYWDVLRKRGNIFISHLQAGKPPVLTFDSELIVDGQTLDRPVNYMLLKIVPPADVSTDPAKRPVMIIDPRAGHGPGIGGMKEVSQVGVALRAGHAVYFAAFHPEPVPGQTIEDVSRAEAIFLQRIAELHPGEDKKPVVVGNCQGGWAVMMLAGAAPELFGVIGIAGAPLSYWAGVQGVNPMRYSGGLMGGTWMASLASDLGGGKFDGVHLVNNFEQLNPANTYWTKAYNLYRKVDTEEQRFLEFEKWWGGWFFLNKEEIRFVVNELFVGNKLTKGSIVSSEGVRIDLKRIRSPIVVIASRGDNITPPPQALNWILDLYRSEDELIANEQVIIYTVHNTIGHLGIFVSGKVALREHAEFVNTLEMIEALPPGLYEMVIEDTSATEGGTDLEHEEYVVRFEERTLDDIRKYDDGREDETAFAAVARLSEINESLYATYVSPWVRACVTPAVAHAIRMAEPMRTERFVWSDMNPFLWWLGPTAETVRDNRHEAPPTNAFRQVELGFSEAIQRGLNAYRDNRDAMQEMLFKSIYGTTLGQAITGIGARYSDINKPQARDLELEESIVSRLKGLREHQSVGGLAEAITRIVLLGAQADRGFDARFVRIARRLRKEHPELGAISPQEMRHMISNQALMVRFDVEHAYETLPALLPTAAQRREAVEVARKLFSWRPTMTPEAEAVLARVERLLGLDQTAQPPATTTPERDAEAPVDLHPVVAEAAPGDEVAAGREEAKPASARTGYSRPRPPGGRPGTRRRTPRPTAKT